MNNRFAYGNDAALASAMRGVPGAAYVYLSSPSAPRMDPDWELHRASSRLHRLLRRDLLELHRRCEAGSVLEYGFECLITAELAAAVLDDEVLETAQLADLAIAWIAAVDTWWHRELRAAKPRLPSVSEFREASDFSQRLERWELDERVEAAASVLWEAFMEHARGLVVGYRQSKSERERRLWAAEISYGAGCWQSADMLTEIGLRDGESDRLVDYAEQVKTDQYWRAFPAPQAQVTPCEFRLGLTPAMARKLGRAREERGGD